MKAWALFLPALLSACESAENIDLSCGGHGVAGRMWSDRAELKVDDIARVFPLQGMFTDEFAAKYAPEHMADPSFAMTIKTYAGLTLDKRTLEFLVYSRDGKTEYYELEIAGEKWQCH